MCCISCLIRSLVTKIARLFGIDFILLITPTLPNYLRSGDERGRYTVFTHSCSEMRWYTMYWYEILLSILLIFKYRKKVGCSCCPFYTNLKQVTFSESSQKSNSRNFKKWDKKFDKVITRRLSPYNKWIFKKTLN